MAELPTAIGRYEIISRLGQGGMGSLYLAKDPKIGRLVAIKLVRQEFDSPDARTRFAREAQSAGTLRHTNIVTIFDVDEHEGLPYIAMEYVDGETLSEIVRRKAPYAVAKRLQWIEELCSGLAYAHRQGVVHRDVKPANLMLDNEGTIKILDFGLARRETSKFTQSQTIIGTPNYMSPEQIRAGDVGPRSDIFAVGAVLYEVVAYAEAFPGSVHQAMHKILYEEPKPLDQVLPNIDRGLVTVLSRALEKEADRRYQDLTVMKADLAIVRQRLETQVDDSSVTIVQPTPTAMRRPASSVRGATSPPLSPASGGSRRVTGTHRVTLQKRRAAQIELHLTEARKSFDSGDLEKAREACESALMFDPDYPSALQLLDEINQEEERRQIDAFLTAARAELQQGRLDAAEKIVAQALELAPQSADVQQLRETIETTRREIERARQIQDMLRRARARFSEGSFEGAIRAVGELLAIDPDNTAARDLQIRAQEAIDARAKRAERDAAAQATVAEARALFDKGDKDSAIARLEAFKPPHDLVTGFLASLRGEQVAEELAPDVVPAASGDVGPATAAFMPGRSDGVHVGTGSRTPVYAGVAAAIVVLIAIGTFVFTRPDSSGPAAPADTATAAGSETSLPPAATPPVPALPPPAVVTPPASLTDQPPQNESDRDLLAAYRYLSSQNHVEASKIAAQIAKRDPKNPQLRELRAQIQKIADSEKERAAALAAAAAAAAKPPPVPTPAPPPAPAPAPAVDPTTKPDLTVLPGGGFAASSEPPAPPLLAEVERPGIQAAINEYSKALSSKDLRAVSRVRTFTEQQRNNWVRTFDRVKSYKLVVSLVGNPVVDATGTKASIAVEERVQQIDKNNFEINLPAVKTEYKLEKIDGRWRILPPG